MPQMFPVFMVPLLLAVLSILFLCHVRLFWSVAPLSPSSEDLFLQNTFFSQSW